MKNIHSWIVFACIADYLWTKKDIYSKLLISISSQEMDNYL